VATWSVASVAWDSWTGGITSLSWSAALAGGDGATEHVTVTGTTAYVPDPESPAFVPLEDVDEELALSWVWAREGRETVEGALLAELGRRLTPGAGLPWVSGVGVA
jgi:hypothetical protein